MNIIALVFVLNARNMQLRLLEVACLFFYELPSMGRNKSLLELGGNVDILAHLSGFVKYVTIVWLIL